MVTPYENLANKLRLAVRQLEQFNKTIMSLDQMELYDIVDRIQYLARYTIVLDITSLDTE